MPLREGRSPGRRRRSAATGVRRRVPGAARRRWDGVGPGRRVDRAVGGDDDRRWSCSMVAARRGRRRRRRRARSGCVVLGHEQRAVGGDGDVDRGAEPGRKGPTTLAVWLVVTAVAERLEMSSEPSVWRDRGGRSSGGGGARCSCCSTVTRRRSACAADCSLWGYRDVGQGLCWRARRGSAGWRPSILRSRSTARA